MSDFVHLIGTEAVEQAARNIVGAADSMSREEVIVNEHGGKRLVERRGAGPGGYPANDTVDLQEVALKIEREEVSGYIPDEVVVKVENLARDLRRQWKTVSAR